MKKLILSGTLVLMVFNCASAQRGDSNRPKRVPEGTTISGNRVALKPGYKFVREPGSRSVGVMRIKNGILIAQFQCNCKAATDDRQSGYCEIAAIEGNQQQCNNSSNCSQCILEVVITRPRPTVRARYR